MERPQPSLESVTTINADGSRRFIHPANVRGRFTRLRAWAGGILIAIYAGLPWIPINGNPAVFLDVERRMIHLFGLTFVPQDFWLAFFLITGLGFALFYMTALFGRLWCGWSCPQTVFVEQVFRRVERMIEGDAAQRRKLDEAPWTGGKIARRAAKWGVFALASAGVAHLLVSYFISLPALYRMMGRSPLENWGMFLFVFLIAGALFFDFTWFREQFCIVLCPYGRLQSALIDDDSIVIGYDRGRGEPRGKPNTAGVGDCIDCRRCIAVCPTGIDIRQGVQMECIACSNCIDACDEVMAKLSRKPGLVRYDSAHGLAGEPTRIIRPRTILYTVLLAIGSMVMALSLATLRPATVTLLRMPGAPYYLTAGTIRNQYMLRVDNKLNKPVHFNVRLNTAKPGMTVSGAEAGIDVPALGQEMRPMVVVMPAAGYNGPFMAEFDVSAGEDLKIEKSAPFLGPDAGQ